MRKINMIGAPWLLMSATDLAPVMMVTMMNDDDDDDDDDDDTVSHQWIQGTVINPENITKSPHAFSYQSGAHIIKHNDRS